VEILIVEAAGDHADRPGRDRRVEGLERGATDYVVKPFSFEELAARVLEAGGIRLDLVERRASGRG
jgi:DNA-binding response OmpR family regulator